MTLPLNLLMNSVVLLGPMVGHDTGGGLGAVRAVGRKAAWIRTGIFAFRVAVVGQDFTRLSNRALASSQAWVLRGS